MSTPIVETRNLKMYFPVGRTLSGKPRRLLKAVDDVSFAILPGQTFGLVGESGCGKTTVGRSIVRLYTPTGGEVLFDGQDIAKLNEKQLVPYRRRMQMIFQDPYASLNPRMTVSSIIAEPLLHSELSAAQREEFPMAMDALAESVQRGEFTPFMLLKNGRPRDFSFMAIGQYGSAAEGETFDDFSSLVEGFYLKRDKIDRMNRRSHELRRDVKNRTERLRRKLSAQREELKKTAGRETLKRSGDLIT